MDSQRRVQRIFRALDGGRPWEEMAPLKKNTFNHNFNIFSSSHHSFGHPRDSREGVLIVVKVGPPIVFNVLVTFVLISVHSCHLSLLVRQLNLILKHELCVCVLLLSPHPLFIIFLLLLLSVLSNLLLSLGFNLFNLIRSQAFKVVRIVSVSCVLTHSSRGVFCHDVAAGNIWNFRSILRLFMLFPCVFVGFLLLSKSSIFFLHLFHHVVSFLGVLIFKHSSHSVEDICLLSISSFFLIFLKFCLSMFPLLLLNPILLSIHIVEHSLLIVYKKLKKIEYYLHPLLGISYSLKRRQALHHLCGNSTWFSSSFLIKFIIITQVAIYTEYTSTSSTTQFLSLPAKRQLISSFPKWEYSKGAM